MIPLILLIAACKGDGNLRGSDLMPEMALTDSLELIYFRTPDSPRYFTYIPTTDKELIDALVKDVSSKLQPENPCMKEGKMYCFKKGEILNTIFFAYTDPDCRLLRYIKNGKLYYFPLSETVKKKLADHKLRAREPESTVSLLRSKTR